MSVANRELVLVVCTYINRRLGLVHAIKNDLLAFDIRGLV